MGSERRKLVRFRVHSPIYASLGENFDRVGKVKDISMRGIAFEYTSSDHDSMTETTQVDILSLDEDIHLSRVPCAVAYEYDLRKHDTLRQLGRFLVTRRCGVKFGDFTETQRAQFERLIARQTSGPLH